MKKKIIENNRRIADAFEEIQLAKALACNFVMKSEFQILG